MARTERVINASPSDVFDVLADPRGYAYWVVGSIEIRDADRDWPARGSRFHHTVGVGPLRLKDQSKVEVVEPGRFLQLKVKTRPLGTARVKLELEPVDGGAHVTMVEDPADTFTAVMFTPLTHLLMRQRNVCSLERLAELAEGRVPMPGEEPGAPHRTPYGEGAVENPLARERREASRAAARGLPATAARGTLAGLAGAAAMSVSTNAEMRLRGRPPSDAPARALARALGIDEGDRARRQALAAAGHVATSVALGVARAAMGRAGIGRRSARAATFALALVPEVAVVPALGASDPPWRWSATDAAVSVLHHGVYAAVTSAALEALEARAS